MAFCTQCGAQVQPDDVFCASCGAQQAASAGPAGPPPKPPSASAKSPNNYVDSLTAQNVSLLCYVPFIGWIGSIVALAAERFRHDRTVRFHAFQGLYLFVLWLFAHEVFKPITDSVYGMRNIGNILQLAVIGAWVFMLAKTSQGIVFRLPILGELAERSVAEQR